MRKIACVGLVVSGVAAAAACGKPPAALEVTLTNASFGTTGSNLFNCTTPAGPANLHGLSNDVFHCDPGRDQTGALLTTPTTIVTEVGCGDGHAAVVTVTCAGTGAGDALTGSVTLSIVSSCGSKDPGNDPKTFDFQDLAPGTTQMSSATLDSCDAFSNLCNTPDPCLYNSFAADISVTNTTR
jgi:hypothetical protein